MAYGRMKGVSRITENLETRLFIQITQIEVVIESLPAVCIVKESTRKTK